MNRLLVAAVGVILGSTFLVTPAMAGSTPVGAPPEGPEATSHLGSTWDAPDTTVRVLDRKALTATASVETVLTPTDNALCDLYTSTFTLRWQAKPGHVLAVVVTHDDGFGSSWRRIDADSWTMSPSGVVQDEISPVVRAWYVRGTHRSDARICPPGSGTVNHVEIQVEGPPRHEATKSVVKRPSRNHLAAVWSWPGQVTSIEPVRVQVTQSTYTEVEAPVGLCEAHLTELDLNVQAVGDNRIIAVGQRMPGGSIQYQNGASQTFSMGVVAHEWFLTGTGTKSAACPADTVSQDRIEIYTDQGRSGSAT